MCRLTLSFFVYFLILLKPSLSFGVESKNSKGCNFLLKEIISRPKELAKPKKFKVPINRKKYNIQYFFSEADQSSSYVYLDNQNKKIIKFYQSGKIKDRFAIESRIAPHKGQANYEYWVTKFYKSHSIPIVDVLSAPQSLRHPITGKRGTWIVKEYIEGITVDSGYEITPKTLNFFGYNSRKKEIFEGTGETLEAIYKKLNREMTRIRLLHTEENFRAYLEKQGIFDPDKLFKGFEKQWRGGDYFRKDNWLYTEEGWILIDP